MRNALILVLLALHGTARAAEPHFELKSSSDTLLPGAILRVELKPSADAPAVESAEGSFADHRILFFRSAPVPDSPWIAFLGVPHWLRSAPPRMEVQVRTAQGSETVSIAFAVPDWAYMSDHLAFPAAASEKLKVPVRLAKLSAKDFERTKKEKAEMLKIYGTLRAEKLWNEPFRQPMKSAITSRFGNQRTLNGKSRAIHDGVDFRARTPSQAFASARGRVAVAKALFYSGNVVVLDHGYGIFTIYGHLSKIGVKVGQLVEAGDLIGLSGATGRVTGPHLHWGAVVNQEKVDPLQLISIIKD